MRRSRARDDGAPLRAPGARRRRHARWRHVTADGFDNVAHLGARRAPLLVRQDASRTCRARDLPVDGALPLARRGRARVLDAGRGRPRQSARQHDLRPDLVAAPHRRRSRVGDPGQRRYGVVVRNAGATASGAFGVRLDVRRPPVGVCRHGGLGAGESRVVTLTAPRARPATRSPRWSTRRALVDEADEDANALTVPARARGDPPRAAEGRLARPCPGASARSRPRRTPPPRPLRAGVPRVAGQSATRRAGHRLRARPRGGLRAALSVLELAEAHHRATRERARATSRPRGARRGARRRRARSCARRSPPSRSPTAATARCSRSRGRARVRDAAARARRRLAVRISATLTKEETLQHTADAARDCVPGVARHELVSS